MPAKDLQAFVKKVKEDKELQKKIAKIPRDNKLIAIRMLATIAKVAGYSIEVKSISATMRKEAVKDLSLEEKEIQAQKDMKAWFYYEELLNLER